MSNNMRKLEICDVYALDNHFLQKHYGAGNMPDEPFQVYVPDACPICQYGIDMSCCNNHNLHDMHDDSKLFNIISIYSCPHCHNGFVIIHHMQRGKNSYIEKSQSVYPPTEFTAQINDDIRNISPVFYEIYNQCMVAKNLGLHQLYGMGFRKALERLVTDFAIKQNSDQVDKILRMSLHDRIKFYFKDSDAKNALMACKWLGNNETHYGNHNSEEDLMLFEELIEDVMYYIHREIRMEKAKQINTMKGIEKSHENHI